VMVEVFVSMFHNILLFGVGFDKADKAEVADRGNQRMVGAAGMEAAFSSVNIDTQVFHLISISTRGCRWAF
jgi:hypothetical protein